jgi:uncharacterized SAM-binding protein YcdF (DUF218 family)
MSGFSDTERFPIPPVAPQRRGATGSRGASEIAERFGEAAIDQVAQRPRGRRGQLVRGWLTSFIAFGLLAPPLLALGLAVAIYRQARTDQLRPAEAIVVLGTAQYNGRPGPVFRARLDRTLEVYRDGNAPLIVVTGGRAPGDEFSEAEAAQAYLVVHGVPEDAILLENQGRNSWASMQGVEEILQPLGVTRILLVSDGFHLLRVKLMARDLGFTGYAVIATESPIRQGSRRELGYVARETGGVIAHIWHTRGPGGGG